MMARCGPVPLLVLAPAGGAPALPDLMAATEDPAVLEKLAGHEDVQIAERAKAALRQVRGGSRQN